MSFDRELISLIFKVIIYWYVLITFLFPVLRLFCTKLFFLNFIFFTCPCCDLVIFFCSSFIFVYIAGFWFVPPLELMFVNQRSNCQHPLDHRKSKRVPEKHLFLLYWLCQSLWLCGSQQTVENFERDGNARPPDLPLEKPVCRSGSNS